MSDPLDFARALIACGVPVFVAPPDATHPAGFRLPGNWQHAKPDPTALEHWEPGWALCALGGHGVDFIDVDPRNGGDVAAAKLRSEGAWPYEYAIVATPSGGTHHYVHGLGVAKTKRDGIDLQAGAPDGSGRGFVFLPGTERVSKVDGVRRGYVLAVDRLDVYVDTIDDVSGDRFRTWIRSTVTDVGAKALDLGPSGSLERFADPVPRGHHDNEGARCAAILAKLGVPHDEAVRILQWKITTFVDVDPKDPFRQRDIDRWLRGAAKFQGTPDAVETDGPDRSTTWAPMSVEAMEGEDTPPPSFLRRDDGKGLLYAGEVNGLIGESESGKSWIAQAACAQALRGGLVVLYVDFESRYTAVAARLRALGVAPEVLRARFRYMAPDEALSDHARRDRDEAATAAAAGIVVLDGVNAAMQVLGLESNSTNDATRFYRDVLRPLAAPGGCVLYVDHIPKTAAGQLTKGAIGSQAKRAMTSGSLLKAAAVKPFGRGTDGVVVLAVDKDRPGHVRGVIPEGKEHVALFVVEHTLTGDMQTRIVAARDASEFMESDRQATMDSEILAFVEKVSQASANVIEKNVTGKGTMIRERIDALVADGRLGWSLGLRGYAEYHSISKA
jgi:hypothetical protein